MTINQVNFGVNPGDGAVIGQRDIRILIPADGNQVSLKAKFPAAQRALKNPKGGGDCWCICHLGCIDHLIVLD